MDCQQHFCPVYRVTETRALTFINSLFMCVWRITAQSASAEQRSSYDVICKGLKEKNKRLKWASVFNYKCAEKLLNTCLSLSLYVFLKIYLPPGQHQSMSYLGSFIIYSIKKPAGWAHALALANTHTHTHTQMSQDTALSPKSYFGLFPSETW